MSGTPFSGVFQTSDGKLFDMMSRSFVDENKSGMSPFSGRFTDAHGETHDLADFIAGLGGSGSGGPVTWNQILNKPTTFSPSEHGHTISGITGLTEALAEKMDGAASIPNSAIQDVFNNL